MTASELHQILLDKWGLSYDVQLRRIKGKIFFQVMWKYLEQVSFPLTEAEYFGHLNQVCNYLNTWGKAQQVKNYIQQTKEKPRIGKAVSIHLDLGEIASEWILE